MPRHAVVTQMSIRLSSCLDMRSVTLTMTSVESPCTPPPVFSVMCLRTQRTVQRPIPADATQLLTHATSDRAVPLDRAVQQPFEQQFGRDLSQVRVYQGSASAQAAEQLGARAYTLGNRIFLGSEASGLNAVDRTRLLTHEAVHTVQQGGAPVAPHAGLTVSSPTDAAEVEARHIADSL